MVKYLLILLFIVVFAFPDLHGQAMPLQSQYHLNQFLLNPAAAGSEGFTSYQFTGREQWIDYYGDFAPSTYSFSAQTRLLKKSYVKKGLSIRKKRKKSSKSGRVGYGGYVFTDQNGLNSRTGIQGTYSYHIPVDRKSQLSFGISAQFFQYRVNKEEMTLDIGEQKPDKLVDNSNLRTWVPDVNAGVLYTRREYYAGLSAENLTQSFVEFGDAGNKNAKLERTYNIIGGYTYRINKRYSIEPNVFVRFTEHPHLNIDFNVKGLYTDSYWASIGYRTSGGNQAGWLILALGLKYEKFYFGYAFDYTMGNIMGFTYGTHEITMALRFGDNSRRYKWLRRY